jgi:hypothetical protein
LLTSKTFSSPFGINSCPLLHHETVHDWLLFFSNHVFSQWVPAASTIPDQIIALSRDGSTAIGFTGVYTKSGTMWTQTLHIPPSYHVNSSFTSALVLFLSDDGSRFAISNLSSCDFYNDASIDIYEALSPEKNVWNISSSIYASSLGIDGFQCLFPTATTSDGETLIIVSNYNADTYSFILLRDGSGEYVFKKQLLYSLPNHGEALTGDGSILSSFAGDFATPGQSTPVQIFQRQSDGMYVLTELYGFVSWSSMSISSNGQYMIGTVCT